MRWLLTIKNKNMAVNVDTVYQRVLAISNKEQRGYITPQEFNLLAEQAQLEIFEQYFYDLDQFRMKPGNDTTYADMIDLIEEKIDIFEKYRIPISLQDSSNENGLFLLPEGYYRMGELYYLCNGNYLEVEKIPQNEIHHIINSPLTNPTINRPVYVRATALTGDNDRYVQLYPTTITSGVVCNFISKPSTPYWSYNVVLDEPLYNANNSTDFELHMSEESNLVLKILELAGVIIKQQDVYSIANQEDLQGKQQEKL
jgi:hypothetical protein